MRNSFVKLKVDVFDWWMKLKVEGGWWRGGLVKPNYKDQENLTLRDLVVARY